MKDDHYAVLGVGATVGTAEIRRAYRRLALRHHPDRAGEGATATFQRIAEAYRVLSNPGLRSSYDLSLNDHAGARAWRPRAWTEPHSGAPDPEASGHVPFGQGPGDPFGAARAAHRRAHASVATARAAASVIVRLSGPLERLVAHSIARTRGAGVRGGVEGNVQGSVIDLYLLPEEASTGGVAAIDLPLTVPCPTCGGLAGRNRLWCRRCEFEGTIVDNVTLCLTIPPFVADGTMFRVAGDRPGVAPTLSVCIHV